MHGDYTRFTFNPTRDYAGVLKQQGRVDLEADWNELVEIFDRRWRAETLDILGPCIVPDSTPDAFRITPAAAAVRYTLGIGRMYVDGMLIENHGVPPRIQFNAALGEPFSNTEVPYNDQPYFPAPLPPPLAATPGNTDLVYLDVWQREVSAIEDPNIREIALGGPDTTTRMQAVWQVKVLENLGQHSCGDPIADWNTLVAPSGGRLTTGLNAPPLSSDPCALNPSGGYRGLENRLYRIEIQRPGGVAAAPGDPTAAWFKWSRDNGSVVAAVEQIPSTSEIIVRQLGRDQVLRFHQGDWIEILDDHIEFSTSPNLSPNPAQRAGHMAQITLPPDPATRRITFSPPIPGTFNFNVADPNRHTRVRRWDGRPVTVPPSTDGLQEVSAGPIVIEDGIEVQFSGSDYRAGDYWVFSARVADGIEILTNARPHGILHHFCRLGFIHWGATFLTTTVTDCRVHWPPHCCEAGCTVTVGDGVVSHGQFTDIQQAINALGNDGGVVCIGRGFYHVTNAISLNQTKRNVTIRGMGPATRIVYEPPLGAGVAAFSIAETSHVTMEGLFVVSPSAEAILSFNNSHFCTVRDCILVNLRAGDINAPAENGRAIRLTSCDGCRIERNVLLAAYGVDITTQVRDLVLEDNTILAVHISLFARRAVGLDIVHNRMAGFGQRQIPVLAGMPLTRQDMDAFLAQVRTVTRGALSGSDFQAVSVLIYSGYRVRILQNRMAAAVGVLLLLALGVSIQENEVLAIIGLLFVFALAVQILSNFVLGIFVGLLHAGIMVDLLSQGNLWLGTNGMVFTSLRALFALPGLGQALLAAFTGTPGNATTGAVNNANKAVGFAAFGLIATIKVDSDLFLTFTDGIYKADEVISADVSITKNTFMICSGTAIDLGSGRIHANLGFLALIFTLQHRIDGNSISVRGAGITSACASTLVTGNTIYSVRPAVELDAEACHVRGNQLYGRGGNPSLTSALIVVHNDARTLLISENQIGNSESHAILFFEGVSDVAIEGNTIRIIRLNGITTLNSGVNVQNLRISRNTIEFCQGGTQNLAPQLRGPIVLGGGSDVSITHNTIVRNVFAAGGTFAAIYAEEVAGLEISSNLIAENGGGVRLAAIPAELRVLGNTIRANSGVALSITGFLGTTGQRFLVHDNHFFRDDSDAVRLVDIRDADVLQFNGNHALHPRLHFLSVGRVTLGAEYLIVNGNTLDVHGFPWPSVFLTGPGAPAGRLIFTSNIRRGFTISGFGQTEIAHNLGF